MRGRLIVVEGLDGVGKTTLSRALAHALRADWLTTPSPELRLHRAPFDAAYGNVPAASHLFYAASVAAASHHAAGLIAAGRNVVIDRYWCSTQAYARAAGSPLDLSGAEVSLHPADVTLYLEISEGERQRRIRARASSAADHRTLEPVRRRALAREFRSALQSPVSGLVKPLRLDHASELEALELALLTVAEALPFAVRLAG